MVKPANQADANAVAAKRLLDSLQNDLRNISSEAKKKYPSLKEAAESGIVRLRAVSTRHPDLRIALLSESLELLEPFFMACDTKQVKLVQISLQGIQRMITFEAISAAAASNLVECLWSLMEAGLEELKLLQTVTLLISTNDVVQGDPLAKSVVLCFRLHFTKTATTNNAASATIRQLVTFIFERVQREDNIPIDDQKPVFEINLEELKNGNKTAPRSLRPAAGDAFLLFQDLIQLVNAEQPFWLVGLTEMTRTFGLELIESILTLFPDIFFKHEEFSFLLKEKVCQLVIKLFSPNIKYRPGFSPIHNARGASGDSSSTNSSSSSGQPVNAHSVASQISIDKPFFPISVRLLRIVSVLIQKYYTMLITESEIFLSLLIKFLEADKPPWQRVIALEVLHRMCAQSNLIRSFCLFYDMKPHSTKILRDIVNAIGIFIQSLFLHPSSHQVAGSSSMNNTSGSSGGGTPTDPGPKPLGSTSATPGGASSVSPQPAFFFRGIYIPLLFTVSGAPFRCQYIESLEKFEPPPLQDGYALSLAVACLMEVVRGITLIIDGSDLLSSSKDLIAKDKIANIADLDKETRLLHENLLNSSWCGLLASLSLLIDASIDEDMTEQLLKVMQTLIALCGVYNLETARHAFIVSICKSSLPPNYTLPVLNLNLLNYALESSSDQEPGSQSQSKQHQRTPSADLINNYHILSNASLLQQQQQLPSMNPPSNAGGGYLINHEQGEIRQVNIVAVGTPLPCPSLPPNVQQGPVMMTSKNLQSMRAILQVAYHHGCVLKNSWHTILSSLQHSVWILGLKPTTGGILKSARSGTEAGSSNNLITTAAMSDLPVLSTMLTRLFESSQYLDDEALLPLIDGLIKLSQESMEMAFNNREPTLFAVAKVLETTVVNLHRVELIWKPVTSHLIDVCNHPHVKMREYGAEALTYTVKVALNALQTSSEENQTKTPRNHYMALAPLQDLSYISHADVRQKQLDCTLQILQSSGDSLGPGWPQILDIVSAINDGHSENLIRIAFQCLQLIVADFLPAIPPYCLVLCVEAISKFGSQTQELNVSLTAIGLLWNIADYLFTNEEILRQAFDENQKSLESQEDTENELPSALPAFDCLWMALFTRLGDLCTDSRPAVRKSAGQTLFSTLSAHGAILHVKTWQTVLWQVLFPLLDRVRTSSQMASTERLPDSKTVSANNNQDNVIFVHHSRNTAQKQWSETQVLTLSGVSRIFSAKRDQLLSIEDFNKAWILLLEFIESSALSRNIEVSISALKCFQELLSISSMPPSEEDTPNKIGKDLYRAAWRVWYTIGHETTKPPQLLENIDFNTGETIRTIDLNAIYIPSQAFLTLLIQLFPHLFIHLKGDFSVEDFSHLSQVLQKSLSVPLYGTELAAVFVMQTQPSSNSNISSYENASYMDSMSISTISLSPLQDSVVMVVEILQKEILSSPQGSVFSLLPSLFSQLLTFSNYACSIPPYGRIIAPPLSVKFNPNEWASANFVPFGERALRMVVSLYQKTANHQLVIKSRILHSIIKALKQPLGIKYACPSHTTWKLAVNVLLHILHIGLPIARQHPSDFMSIWADLALTLDGFLFSQSIKPLTQNKITQATTTSLSGSSSSSSSSSGQAIDDYQSDESYDVKIVELIRDDILPHAGEGHMPPEFVLQIVSILNKGSIHSATTTSPVDPDCTTRRLREEFARTCFETLLQFSFLGPKGNPELFIDEQSHSGFVNRLAVNHLLQRFNEVIVKYVDDERLAGKCPLPRHRMAEISFVLKALATLVSSLKKAPLDSVEPGVWEQLIGLYPHLVDCSMSSSLQVGRSLREVLHEFADLLQPPKQQLQQASQSPRTSAAQKTVHKNGLAS